MSELVACLGATLKVSPPDSGGTFVILPIGGGSFGSKAACQGAEVYTAISFTVTGVVTGTVANGSGAGVITGGGDKVKASAALVVRQGDSVDITVTDANPPYGTDTATIEVDDPGQDKARAE